MWNFLLAVSAMSIRHFCFLSCRQTLETLFQHTWFIIRVCKYFFFIPTIRYNHLFCRYSTMTCGTASSHTGSSDRPRGSGLQSFYCFGVTDSGSLHVLRLAAGDISLEHIIPSMQTVCSGSAGALDMVLASPMEVRLYTLCPFFCFQTVSVGSRHDCAVDSRALQS